VFEMRIKVREAASEPGTEDISTQFRNSIVKEGRETALVHLTGTEVEPRLQSDPVDCAIARRKLLLGNQIGNVLDDCGSFGEQRPTRGDARPTGTKGPAGGAR
jgi:hypothetical protein